MSAFSDHADNPETYEEFLSTDEAHARHAERLYQARRNAMEADDAQEPTHERSEADYNPANMGWLFEAGCTEAEAVAFVAGIERKPAGISPQQGELFGEVA